jgi:hypothetical protein
LIARYDARTRGFDCELIEAEDAGEPEAMRYRPTRACGTTELTCTGRVRRA